MIFSVVLKALLIVDSFVLAKTLREGTARSSQRLPATAAIPAIPTLRKKLRRSRYTDFGVISA